MLVRRVHLRVISFFCGYSAADMTTYVVVTSSGAHTNEAETITFYSYQCNHNAYGNRRGLRQRNQNRSACAGISSNHAGKSLQELGSGSKSLMSAIELHSEPHLTAK
jgi:hypothetical protein